MRHLDVNSVLFPKCIPLLSVTLKIYLIADIQCGDDGENGIQD